ncbi:hypothetical protein PR048_024553 [Dryococelus australis]|uniref:Uncharacterized protein n=1 Tax=Dryococelus australis TaxID=614101 RepID=A0ABQ9GNZ5_9NEOP|nr:hypothetical protein PR048_024553 [Dryococelus australis]
MCESLSSALKEMFKMPSISTNTCINPPLQGHQDALMNPWKIPENSTRHNTATECAHVVHWGRIRQGSSAAGKRLRITAAMAFHSTKIQPVGHTLTRRPASRSTHHERQIAIDRPPATYQAARFKKRNSFTFELDSQPSVSRPSIRRSLVTMKFCRTEGLAYDGLLGNRFQLTEEKLRMAASPALFVPVAENGLSTEQKRRVVRQLFVLLPRSNGTAHRRRVATLPASHALVPGSNCLAARRGAYISPARRLPHGALQLTATSATFSQMWKTEFGPTGSARSEHHNTIAPPQTEHIENNRSAKKKKIGTSCKIRRGLLRSATYVLVNLVRLPNGTKGRLHQRGSKLDLGSDLRSTLKTIAPFEFRAGLEIEFKFISNRRTGMSPVRPLATTPLRSGNSRSLESPKVDSPAPWVCCFVGGGRRECCRIRTDKKRRTGRLYAAARIAARATPTMQSYQSLCVTSPFAWRMSSRSVVQFVAVFVAVFNMEEFRTEQLIDEVKKKASLCDTSSEEYKNRQLSKMQWIGMCTPFCPDFHELAGLSQSESCTTKMDVKGLKITNNCRKRKNTPTSGVIRHDSYMLKSGSYPAGNRTRFALVGCELSLAAAPTRDYATLHLLVYAHSCFQCSYYLPCVKQTRCRKAIQQLLLNCSPRAYTADGELGCLLLPDRTPPFVTSPTTGTLLPGAGVVDPPHPSPSPGLTRLWAPCPPPPFLQGNPRIMDSGCRAARRLGCVAAPLPCWRFRRVWRRRKNVLAAAKDTIYTAATQRPAVFDGVHLAECARAKRIVDDDRILRDDGGRGVRTVNGRDGVKKTTWFTCTPITQSQAVLGSHCKAGPGVFPHSTGSQGRSQHGYVRPPSTEQLEAVSGVKNKLSTGVASDLGCRKTGVSTRAPAALAVDPSTTPPGDSRCRAIPDMPHYTIQELGEMEGFRENPPTSGIDRHDSPLRESRSRTRSALVPCDPVTPPSGGSKDPLRRRLLEGLDTLRYDQTMYSPVKITFKCYMSISWLDYLPSTFHSRAAPYSLRFTLIGSQDPDAKSRPNFYTPHACVAAVMLGGCVYSLLSTLVSTRELGWGTSPATSIFSLLRPPKSRLLRGAGPAREMNGLCGAARVCGQQVLRYNPAHSR